MNKPNTKSLAIYEIVSNMETECEDLRKENKKLLERISELEEIGKDHETLLRIINRAKEPIMIIKAKDTITETPTLMRSKEHKRANTEKLGKLG